MGLGPALAGESRAGYGFRRKVPKIFWETLLDSPIFWGFPRGPVPAGWVGGSSLGVLKRSLVARPPSDCRDLGAGSPTPLPPTAPALPQAAIERNQSAVGRSRGRKRTRSAALEEMEAAGDRSHTARQSQSNKCGLPALGIPRGSRKRNARTPTENTLQLHVQTYCPGVRF